MSTSQNESLVSVIIPTFKRYNFLLETLRTIASQSYQNLEVLVVADGADEQTRSVVEGLRDSRFKYLFVEHAGFPAVARNLGLRSSQGQYLAFCDDDDVWYREKLATQIEVMTDSEFTLCTTDYDFINESGATLAETTQYDAYTGQFTWEQFFHSMGFICNAAVVIQRDLYDTVGAVNEAPELKSHEDFEYWMRILQHGNGFFVDQKLVGYRVHAGSIQARSAWRTYQSRLALHRILRKQINIPASTHGRKQAKLATNFLLEQFPPAGSVFRYLQRQLR